MSTTNHDEAKLPKWAQDRLDGLRSDIENLKYANAELQNAHAILHQRQWTTLPGPRSDDREYVRLWVFNRDDALQVATLYKDDVLMIGRAKR